MEPTRANDCVALEIMHRTLNLGMSYDDAGKPFGKTRSAVAGLMKRIRDEGAGIKDDCLKPENKDGGMSERWWVK